jgi:hypothetical protein
MQASRLTATGRAEEARLATEAASELRRKVGTLMNEAESCAATAEEHLGRSKEAAVEATAAVEAATRCSTFTSAAKVRLRFTFGSRCDRIRSDLTVSLMCVGGSAADRGVDV